MVPARSITQVFDAIQRAKEGASSFCTNFFPVQKRIENWIERRELFLNAGDSAAFFFRQDRDFWHLYYCASNPESLVRECAALPELQSVPMTSDLVGDEKAIAGPRAALEIAGFRRYRRLQRMARIPRPLAAPESIAKDVVVAAKAGDSDAILHLLDSSFDRFADQLPMAYEIEAALAAHQILAVKPNDEIGAILFFETQGFTSTLRYWAVDERSRSNRLGSALMRHYFAMHGAVRRFVLWVVAENQNAVQKYEHYGYVADGLTDQVLVNARITA